MSPNSTSDIGEIILQLAKNPRDPEPWRMLHLRLWPYVMALSYRHLGAAREVVEDASQEVFLRLVQYPPFDRITSPAAFYAYVRKICSNVAADYRLQVGRLREVQTPEESSPEHPESRRPDLDVETDRLRDELLSGMNDSDKHLVHLMFEGYSLNEIAEALGISYSNAGVRVHRLRQRMSKLMQ